MRNGVAKTDDLVPNLGCVRELFWKPTSELRQVLPNLKNLQENCVLQHLLPQKCFF